MTEREHVPVRPEWSCLVCGQEWPCAAAKAQLAAEYAEDHTALIIYLGVQMGNALDDASSNYRDGPRPTGMRDRFFAWTDELPGRDALRKAGEGADRTVARAARAASIRLVGVAEICDLVLKIYRDRILELTFRGDFPKPAAELVEGDVWIAEEVEVWFGQHQASLFDPGRRA